MDNERMYTYLTEPVAKENAMFAVKESPVDDCPQWVVAPSAESSPGDLHPRPENVAPAAADRPVCDCPREALSPAVRVRPEDLLPRPPQSAVLSAMVQLLLEGHTNWAISKKLSVPRRTVDRWLAEQWQVQAGNSKGAVADLSAVDGMPLASRPGRMDMVVGTGYRGTLRVAGGVPILAAHGSEPPTMWAQRELASHCPRVVQFRPFTQNSDRHCILLPNNVRFSPRSKEVCIEDPQRATPDCIRVCA
jgi:hypothetical protein